MGERNGMSPKRRKEKEDYKELLIVFGLIILLLGITTLLQPISLFNVVAGIFAILVGLFLVTLPIEPEIAKDFAKTIINLITDLYKKVSLKVGEKKGQYFVKNLRVHRYPVPSRCNVQYTGEQLHSSPPAGYEKCDLCFGLPP